MTALNILYICGVIGILDTLYLIYHKMRGTEVACIFFPKEWCYKVQHSPQSKTFGIPNSMAGFGMYVLILAFTYYFSAGVTSFLWVKYIVTFGFLFSMYFTYVQAFVLRAFCTWCVVSAINFTVMAYVVWFM
ncbi:MAG: vitamin K epoxide reductase family protein [Minisyncoccota bacterium]